MFTLHCLFFVGLLSDCRSINDGDKILIGTTDLSLVMCSNRPGRKIELLADAHERCVFTLHKISGGCPEEAGHNIECFLIKVENGLNEGVTTQCLTPITSTLELQLPRIGLKDCDLNDPKQKWEIVPPVLGIVLFMNTLERKCITRTSDDSFDVNLETCGGMNRHWMVTLND